MSQPSTKPGYCMPQKTISTRHQCGFSLIELMISITIGLLIMAGMLVVFANTSSTRNEVERMSRQIENGRYASELLRDDLRHAGYYGELNTGALGVPALPDPCSTTLATWAGALKIHVQGVDGYTSGALSCLPSDVKLGTDVIVIRRTKTCKAGIDAGCDAAVDGLPYLQVPLCATETVTHTLDIKSSTNFNVHQNKNCSTTAALRQFLLYIYYVSTTNGSGQNVPTLKRAEFTGAGFAITPLVEGIENMQINYGVDADGDGDPDSYVTAPTTAIDWSNVVTVKVGLLARNIDASPGYADSKTYKLLDLDVASPGDGYRRHVYTTLVRLQNPSGRRDIP